MNTLKVNWNRDAGTKHSVYQCKQYAVYEVNTHDADGVTQLLMFQDTAEKEESTEVLLYSGAKAYAMNDNGATIDTINGTSIPTNHIPF
jgi:hypothetical protein